MSDEIFSEGYMNWPAIDSDLIKIMCWSGDKPVNTHKHQFIEIAFLAFGSCVHTYHKSDVRLIPGDVFIITPHEEHSYKIDSKTVIYNCLFYPQVLGEDWDKLKEIKNIYDLLIVEPFYRSEVGSQEILHLNPSEVIYVESVLKTMLQEQEQKLLGFELMHKSNLAILLCLLGRVWKKQLVESEILYEGKRDLLTEALQFIETNINSQLNIKKIASQVYLSPNYFRKVFKEKTGLTPIEYINKIRIARAFKLLSENNASISQAAEAVGINDLNYFSRLFKSLAGCSPSEVKKKSELY
ncbi:MAG TPA: AraC family transcriptional regulator [Ruminiclostridium sp.]